jgi:hypothetical protein
LLVAVIFLPLISLILAFTGFMHHVPGRGESVIYWWMIFTRLSSLGQNSWCGWVVFITLALLVIFIVDVTRHRALTKTTVGSFLLLANIGCCFCSSLLLFIGNDRTAITHIQSVNFEGTLYHLAYEQSVIVPMEIYAGEFIPFRCTPPGLWCEPINKIPFSETRFTDLQNLGQFVIEQDKLYVKVGEEMVLVAT